MERRLTKQRSEVLEYVKKVRTHPTAEMVFQEIKNKVPGITLATVYRNLHLLAESGDIRKLMINGEYHFDGFVKEHQHFWCIKCNEVHDIEDNKLMNYTNNRMNERGFIVSEITLSGY